MQIQLFAFSALAALLISRHHVHAFRCYYLGSRASLDQTLQAYLPALPFPIFHPRLARWPPDAALNPDNRYDDRVTNWIPLTIPGREHTLQCAPNQLPPPSLDDINATRTGPQNNPNNIEIINLQQQQMCYGAFGTFGAELSFAPGSSGAATINDGSSARLAKFKPGEFFSSFGCVDAKLQSDLVGLFGSADVLNTHAVFTDGCHVLRRAGTQFDGALTRTTYTFEDLRRFNTAAQVPPELIRPLSSSMSRAELGTSAWEERNTTLARGGVEAVFCFCSTRELCNDAVQLEASVKQNYLDRSADVAIAAAIERSTANGGRQSRASNTDQQAGILSGGGSLPPVFILSENIDTADGADINDIVTSGGNGRTGRDVSGGNQQPQQLQNGRYVKCHRQFLRLPASEAYKNNLNLPTLEQTGTITGLNQITRTRAGDCPIDTEYCFYFDGEQPAYPWLNLAADTARSGSQKQSANYYYDGILVNNFNPNVRYADERETFFWRGCLSPDIRTQLQNQYNFNFQQQSSAGSSAVSDDANGGSFNGSNLRYALPRLMLGYTERCFPFSMSRGQVRGKFCACRAKYCYGQNLQMVYGQNPDVNVVRAPRAEAYADRQQPQNVPAYVFVAPTYADTPTTTTSPPNYYSNQNYYTRAPYVARPPWQLSNNNPDYNNNRYNYLNPSATTPYSAPVYAPLLLTSSSTEEIPRRPQYAYRNDDDGNNNYNIDRSYPQRRTSVVGVNSDDAAIRRTGDDLQRSRRTREDFAAFPVNNDGYIPNNNNSTDTPFVIVNGSYYYKTNPSALPTTTATVSNGIVLLGNAPARDNNQANQNGSTLDNITLRWSSAPNGAASIDGLTTSQRSFRVIIFIACTTLCQCLVN